MSVLAKVKEPVDTPVTGCSVSMKDMCSAIEQYRPIFIPARSWENEYDW